MTEVRLVLTTAPDLETARTIVRELVDGRHAACGNILPGVVSLFRWKGAVQTESEVLVLLKSSASATEGLLRKAKELHPYEVPELLVLPVAAGDAQYMDWVAEETSGETRD